MKATLKRLLICLDLSEMDQHVLDYVHTSTQLLTVKQVTLVHVILRSANGKLNNSAETKKKIKQQLKERFESRWSNSPPEKLSIKILAGDPVAELLNIAKQEEAEVIVLGRKQHSETEAKLPRILARRALCSVLTVPERSIGLFKKILIPFDFSENSEEALQRMAHLVAGTHVELVCLHIYHLPKGYLQSGKTKEEFAAIMLENAQKRANIFFKNLPLDNVKYRTIYELDTEGIEGRIIYDKALEQSADLVCIGSRGRTDIAAAFLGSTTERLLYHNTQIPTLVLKLKKQNLSLFEALLRI